MWEISTASIDTAVTIMIMVTITITTTTTEITRANE